MAKYIECTEELMLAMNAGARAIENKRRYHGAVYTKDLFSEISQEIPYLLAAKVLREASDAPAADVAPVVRCRDCANFRQNAHGVCWCDEYGGAITPNDYCSRAATDKQPRASIPWEAD